MRTGTIRSDAISLAALSDLPSSLHHSVFFSRRLPTPPFADVAPVCASEGTLAEGFGLDWSHTEQGSVDQRAKRQSDFGSACGDDGPVANVLTDLRYKGEYPTLPARTFSLEPCGSSEYALGVTFAEIPPDFFILSVRPSHSLPPLLPPQSRPHLCRRLATGDRRPTRDGRQANVSLWRCTPMSKVRSGGEGGRAGE